jgi:hypothetical protein
MGTTAKRITTLAGLMLTAVAVLAPAQAGRAQPSRSGHPQPRRASRTPSDLSGTGCPADGPVQATPPDQCVSIPSRLRVTVKTSGNSCVQNEYVEVKVPARLSYEAVWYSTIGLGTRWWSSPGTRYPHKVTGLGAKYKVPKGWSAWSAAGGSGPAGSCSGQPPTGTYGTAGWAVVGCNTPRLLAAAPAGRPVATAASRQSANSSKSGQQAERGQVLSDIQTKVLGIVNDVTCHKAKKGTARTKRWDSYIKGGAIKTKTKLPGKVTSPLSVDLLVTAPSTGKTFDVAKQSLRLRHTGTVTLKLPFTHAGRTLIRHWLAGKHVALTALVSAYDPSLGWPDPPGFGTPPTSTTSAGYEYANYVAIPESLSAAMVVPKVKCHPMEETAVYPEVGVEDNTTAAGLVIGCEGTHAFYWPSVTVDNAVTNFPHNPAHPGDKIELGIAQSSSSTTAAVTDMTHKFTVHQTGAGNSTGNDLFVGLGAWNDSTELGVPDFGTLSMSKALLSGSPFGSFGTPSDLRRYDRYTSSDSSGAIQIATGAFAGNHEDFQLTYKRP